MILFLRVLLLVLFAHPAMAQDTDQPASLVQKLTDTKVKFKVTPLADGILRDGEWSALHAVIENHGDPMIAVLRTEARTGGGTEVYSRRVELPAGTRKDVLLYYKPGSGGTTRRVDLLAGRRSMAVEYAPRFAQRDHVAVAVLGDSSAGVQGIRLATNGPVPARAPQASSQFGDDDEQRKVHVGLVPLTNAPDRSHGYNAFNWLVWPQADPSKLTPAQVDALRNWVAGGGHLFLSVTSKWRQVQESPLGPALPARFTGVQDTDDVGNLVSDLGIGFASPGATPMATTTPIDAPNRRIFVLSESTSGPLHIAGTYGLGTVHVITADPTVAPFDQVQRADLWRALLHLPTYDTGHAPPLLRAAMDTQYGAAEIGYGQLDTPFVESMLQYLQDIPGVAPLPITWLLLFSGLYLLVIGPFDYFVLRAIRKQPLTWITFPIYIVLFSTVALVGTSWVKGSQAVVMRYEVVDILPGTDLWRGASWYGIWSTTRSDLSLVSSQPEAVVELIDGRGYQEDVGFTTGQGPVQMSWRAQTWTESHARTLWTGPGQGGIRVERVGENMTVYNDTNVQISDARLHQNGEWWSLGELAPGGTKQVAVGDMSTFNPTDHYGGREDAEAWALDRAFDYPEGRRGHLDFAEWAVVMGRLPSAVEDVTLAGLSPQYHSHTILRAPVHISLPESTP